MHTNSSRIEYPLCKGRRRFPRRDIFFFNRARRSNSVKFQRISLGRRARSDACVARPNCRPFLFGRVEKLAKAVGTPPPAICKIMTAAWKECIMRDISRLRAPAPRRLHPSRRHPPTHVSISARPMHYRYTANTRPATVHKFHGNFVIGLASLVLPPSSSISNCFFSLGYGYVMNNYRYRYTDWTLRRNYENIFFEI